jgi:hypothetical protein
MIDAVRELTESVGKILPPRIVIDEFSKLARSSSCIVSRMIGRTEQGLPIEAYEIGSGSQPVLCYAFPDPGEAVGGTGALALMQGVVQGHPSLHHLPVRWHMIPCLNFDDQPHQGEALGVVKQAIEARDVDWCLRHPRAETTALLTYAHAVRPVFTFAMHDEYHSGELRSAYVPVSHVLEPLYCQAIRQCLCDAGYAIDATYHHPTMGEGFFEMKDVGPYPESTFSVLAQHGLVFICEVSDNPALRPSEIVHTQLCAGLIAAHSVIENR